MNEKLQQAYIEMAKRCYEDNKCAISFYELAVELDVSKNDAIALVNELVRRDRIQFVCALESFGHGDYLNEYLVLSEGTQNA